MLFTAERSWFRGSSVSDDEEVGDLSLPIRVVAAFAALAPIRPGGGLRLRALGGQLHAAFNAADLAWSAATAISSKLLGGGGAVGGGPGGP